MKKYLITIIAVIVLVVSLYALDGFGIVNIPLNDAKVTVKIFKQDAETGELLLEEQDLVSDPALILTEEDLPKPEDLDADKDFSENV